MSPAEAGFEASPAVKLALMRHCPEGSSLLEMMMVITVILIVASISAPIYMTAVVRAREAVLRDDLLEAVSSQPSAFSEPAESC